MTRNLKMFLLVLILPVLMLTFAACNEEPEKNEHPDYTAAQIMEVLNTSNLTEYTITEKTPDIEYEVTHSLKGNKLYIINGIPKYNLMTEQYFELVKNTSGEITNYIRYTYDEGIWTKTEITKAAYENYVWYYEAVPYKLDIAENTVIKNNKDNTYSFAIYIEDYDEYGDLIVDQNNNAILKEELAIATIENGVFKSIKIVDKENIKTVISEVIFSASALEFTLPEEGYTREKVEELINVSSYDNYIMDYSVEYANDAALNHTNTVGEFGDSYTCTFIGEDIYFELIGEKYFATFGLDAEIDVTASANLTENVDLGYILVKTEETELWYTAIKYAAVTSMYFENFVDSQSEFIRNQDGTFTFNTDYDDGSTTESTFTIENGVVTKAVIKDSLHSSTTTYNVSYNQTAPVLDYVLTEDQLKDKLNFDSVDNYTIDISAGNEQIQKFNNYYKKTSDGNQAIYGKEEGGVFYLYQTVDGSLTETIITEEKFNSTFKPLANSKIYEYYYSTLNGKHKVAFVETYEKEDGTKVDAVIQIELLFNQNGDFTQAVSVSNGMITTTTITHGNATDFTSEIIV